MSARRFLDRFEKACPKNKIEKLRKRIKDDIDQRRFEDEKPLCFMLFHTYSILLIPLGRYPEEFQNLYTEAVFDLDMKDDLERAKVINWCGTIYPLHPLKTTADGNCLANAVSLGLWGIEDKDAILRRLLYVTMTTDPRGMFKKRWMFQQSCLPEMPALNYQLNTEQYELEWNNIIKATCDIENKSNQGLPYAFLEAVHLYIIVNIIRRPVILLADNRARNLFGESIQESDIGGIYLPLEWDPKDCVRYPLVIGYSMNHFAPLVAQEETTDTATKTFACPIVTPDILQMKVQFLLPNEDSNVISLLTKYLHVEEVRIKNRDRVLIVPCARLKTKPLADDMNIIQEHRKDCEKIFRFQMDEEAGHVPQNNGQNLPKTQQRFNFKVMDQNHENSEAKRQTKHHQTKTVNLLTEPKTVKRRCITVGCKMYGSAEFNGLCSKCFKDFTVQYAEDEAESRWRRKHTDNNALQVVTHRPAYNDLSIMNENCQTGCGCRCSTETYPYCHECYPRYVNQTKAHQTRPVLETPDLSVMPDKCREPSCTYQASNQTFPYCHQCYDKHVQKALPTAPPVSIQESTPLLEHQLNQHLQLKIDSKEETHIVETSQPAITQMSPTRLPVTNEMSVEANLNNFVASESSGVLERKCKTGGCLNNAVKGNDGFCDKCYTHSMFGEGNVDEPVIQQLATCKIPGCTEQLASGCEQCLGCFLKDGKLHSIPKATTSELNMHSKFDERTSNHNVVITDLRTHTEPLNQHIVPTNDRPSPAVQESMGIALLPAANRDARIGTQPNERKETNRKYICAKAGCEGIRIDNTNGLCYDCSKRDQPKPPEPHSEQNNLGGMTNTNLNESTPFMSSTPCIHTEAEMKELNPVIVSSKQRIKCAATICNNMIYPPKKLCEDCTAAIEKSRAGELRHTAPIAKPISGELRHTAPIAKPKPPQELQRHTVPIAKHRAKLCIEKDCERYGDPAQEDRCSWHYTQAKQRFFQPSPPLTGALMKHAQNSYPPTIPINGNKGIHYPMNVPITAVPVEHDDKLTVAMRKIENNRKSKNKCRRTGCDNYANPAKHGFCNHCYNLYPVQALLDHSNVVGVNQVDF